MKVLNPKTHGILDYAAIALFFLAPSLFGMSGTAASISYSIAAGYLALALLTAYPLGLIKAIPFPFHGAVEFVMAIALVAMPWLAGFSADASARNFYVAAGAGLFLVWLVTDYSAARSLGGISGVGRATGTGTGDTTATPRKEREIIR